MHMGGKWLPQLQSRDSLDKDPKKGKGEAGLEGGLARAPYLFETALCPKCRAASEITSTISGGLTRFYHCFYLVDLFPLATLVSHF